MKTLYLFCLILLFHDVYAQKNDTIRKYLDGNMQFTSKALAVYPAIGFRTTGAWFLQVAYPDTTPLLKAYFKDKNFKVKNGPYLLYHRKRVKALEGTFVNNTPQGLWRYWYENGQIKDSGLLVNNIMSGSWKSWAPNGQLLIVAQYAKTPANGSPAGGVPPIKSGKKGSVLPEISPVPGTREGLAIGYYPNGYLRDSGEFKNNLRTGAWKTWYETGQLESVGSYVNGNMQGDWTYYRNNGAKSTDETYVTGKLQSLTCYDSMGNKEGSYCPILKPPVPQGPFDDFAEYVLDNVFWPKQLENSTVEGIVKVEYVITKQGELKNFKIVESPHQLFSDEVTRFFSTIEKWSPAVSHNRVIDFPMMYEVPFRR
jgi:antitoxin component YwqK of YwqJK toxin-antitoxin module